VPARNCAIFRLSLNPGAEVGSAPNQLHAADTASPARLFAVLTKRAIQQCTFEKAAVARLRYQLDATAALQRAAQVCVHAAKTAAAKRPQDS